MPGGGKIGNNNAAKGKEWSDAVRKVLNETVADTFTGPPKSKLKRKRLIIIARKLAIMAQQGDIAAIKEMGDRVEGKVAQSVMLTGADGGPVKTESKTLMVAGVDSKNKNSK